MEHRQASVPPAGAGAGVDAWCWTWAVGSSPVARERYTGALDPEWFAPDLLSGVHVSDEADLASCTTGKLRLAGLDEELVGRLGPYCGLVGIGAVQALRQAPLHLAKEEADAVCNAWRMLHG